MNSLLLAGALLAAGALLTPIVGVAVLRYRTDDDDGSFFDSLFEALWLMIIAGVMATIGLVLVIVGAFKTYS